MLCECVHSWLELHLYCYCKFDNSAEVRHHLAFSGCKV